MKATIDRYGMLALMAESQLEEHALKKWSDENNTENMIIILEPDCYINKGELFDFGREGEK